MAIADLTAARLREVLHYDADTGIFTWRIATGRRRKAGDVAGNTSVGYCRIGIDGRIFYAHRLAVLYVTGEWPKGGEVDHRNAQRGDNRWNNLRDSTSAANKQNLHGPRSHSSTGFLGVFPRGRKYISVIVADGKPHYLGQFGTPEDAHEAYKQAKRRLHKACEI